MIKYIHSLAYAAMSAGYVGTCVGMDKVAVSAALATIYLLLAVCAFFGDRH